MFAKLGMTVKDPTYLVTLKDITKSVVEAELSRSLWSFIILLPHTVVHTLLLLEID